MRVAVLGAGAWGTALARVLSRQGHEVILWGHHPQRLEEIRRTGQNSRLPGVTLPADWVLEADLVQAAAGGEVIVVAVPSKGIETVAESLTQYSGVLISVTKGIQYDTGLTMCGVLGRTIPSARLVGMSGPTLAMEVARGVPTAIVAASSDAEAAELVQRLFHRPEFRVYTNSDLLGVEMGGALKNVVAIAAGIGDGLGFGDNSKAALITRGIVEIQRLGVACGAKAETFGGLSGLGDLTVTCYSKLSRNRALGERLGKGEKLEKILAESEAVAEGYPTARSSYRLARKQNVSTPIIDEVYKMLYEGKDVREAVSDLMSRESKPEQW